MRIVSWPPLLAACYGALDGLAGGLPVAGAVLGTAMFLEQLEKYRSC